ncbi:MAG: 3-hydroxyacyl-ACP dehydratase [Bacteroidota bacterium]|nr:3-hydroxyacyl-ACP dehydratase [Bacteroidota bacterium]
MIADNILLYIPQREPFVMVDTLMHVEEGKAITNFTITRNNLFCEEGFFTEAGILENIAQTVAAGNGYIERKANKKVSLRYIAGIKNFEVFFLPKVYDVLITDTVVIDKIFNMTTISGKIVCNNKLVARCEMKIF